MTGAWRIAWTNHAWMIRAGRDMRRGDPGFDRMGGQNYPEAQMPMEGQSGGRGKGCYQSQRRDSAPACLSIEPRSFTCFVTSIVMSKLAKHIAIGCNLSWTIQIIRDSISRLPRPWSRPWRRVSSALDQQTEPRNSAHESPPVEILPGQQLLLAQTSPAPRTTVRETGQSFQKPGTFPSAKVMALIFDAPRSTDIPGSVELSPGGAVCFTEDTEIPLWNRSWLKEEKNFKFRTDFDVLDVRGGDVAGKVKLITKPGEILVRDPAGRIKVLRELDDLDLVAKYSFPKEEPGGRGEGGLDTGRAGHRGRWARSGRA